MIGLSEISKILKFICELDKKKLLSTLPIEINLKKGIFEDKLSYILLECICYYLINNGKSILYLKYDCQPTICNEGIEHSCLKYINKKDGGEKEFLDKFNFDIYKKHYRKIIHHCNVRDDQVSITVQDIDSYMKNCGIHESFRARISDVVGELVDNALEHSKSDCLIDIDITDLYRKKADSYDSDDKYQGLNIVVLNFSEILLGQSIAKKISYLVEKPEIRTKRYNEVMKAKEFHSYHWTDCYTEDDFNIITSFQHKISCRIDACSTGGTGLTSLIKALEDDSDAYECYVLSGKRKINFIKSMLIYNEEGWVGFNQSGNYLSDIPDRDCLENSKMNFVGTAYNLNFAMKYEVIKDEASY